MKFDMGGAAAVLGAAKLAGLEKPKDIEIHFVVPTVENMISSAAYRPGDVLTIMNGKTVEVVNTDAEGRLILADALSYVAEDIKPDEVVDIATLTGAQLIALGLSVAAYMATDETLEEQFKLSARKAGELFHNLPFVEQYKGGLESHIADLANVSDKPYGGTIMAGMFLRNFVGEVPYVHLDIAGPVWDFKTNRATGFGVRSLYTFATRNQ
eukprot:Trichotokara_eunicae@DN3883_c0_g1_i1.p1